MTIRPLKAWQEYLDCEELQRIVWQMPDWRDAVPANMLITAHKNGGILIGAFDPAERMVGFAFSFPGLTESSGKPILKHCSHMLAVLPEYQGQKIGEQLKFVQRQAALAQGIALMTWTYDPLLGLNANLNLVRLGTIARHYIVNAYGEMTDGLNAGLPSDRFQVEWWMNAPRVVARIDTPPTRTEWDAVRESAEFVFDVAFDSQGLPRIDRVNDVPGDNVAVEIPFDLAAVKSADSAIALEWRMQTRRAFQSLFQAGYIAHDFVIARNPPRRAAYLLTRQPIDMG